MPLSSVTPNRKATADYGRPAYSRIDELGRQDSALSRSGSEPDSLLDLYRHNASNGNGSSNSIDNDIPENMYKPEPEDPEGWIHRDKLAKIESEELQAAGINLANARRTHSKTVRRDTSRGRKSEETVGSERREDKKPRLSEPALEEEDDDREDWDLRSPEEIAAESAASNQIYTQPILRKSGSRIPVLTSSPHPVPPERVERDTPLPRKRTISNSMSPDDNLSISKIRNTKGSLGSQPLRDAIGVSTPTPVDDAQTSSKPSSPSKITPKVTSASPPGTLTGRKTTPATRKQSVPMKTKEPASTTVSPQQRPGTRGGELDRPRTAINRPEGDPPWLATMYKPDPMLPPDQQIIPTHARKQQQALWTEDGSVPKTYDRDFTPIAVHSADELAKRNSSNLQAAPDEKAEMKAIDATAWPLKPMSSVRSQQNGRPGTSGSGTGGYSTMPKITNPPVQSPRMGSVSSTKAAPPQRFQEQRPPVDDDGTVKKGCGCCVVM